MTRVGVISDEFWAAVEPLMPSDMGKRGHRFVDHRLIMEGIAWRFRTGSPWRDLPADFGPWQTVWKRHHRFSFDGTYLRMFEVMRHHWVDGELDEGLARLLSVDSTVVRAHQHAAGAPAAGTQGAESNYKNPAVAEPDDHALGRSRGGLTTKIHALTDTATCPVAMSLTAGQADDNPALLPLVDGYFGAEATADSPAMCGCWPTRPTRIPPPVPRCAGAGSATRFPSETTRSLIARPKARPAAAHRRSTPKSTSSATPLNAASTGSNNGAESPPATTNTH